MEVSIAAWEKTELVSRSVELLPRVKETMSRIWLRFPFWLLAFSMRTTVPPSETRNSSLVEGFTTIPPQARVPRLLMRLLVMVRSGAGAAAFAPRL